METIDFMEPTVDQRSRRGPSLKSSSPDPTMARTRCPHCMKLFSIETADLEMLTAAGVRRAEFQCSLENCKGHFAIALPLARLPEFASDLIPALPLAAARPDVGLESRPGSPPGSRSEQSLEQPLSGAEKATVKSKAVDERECARCGAVNPVASLDCVRCGIVFERSITGSARRAAADVEFRVEEELALGGNRELAALWDLVIEDYEDRIRHERFLNACQDVEALSYGAKKYSQILAAAPQDEIARYMRNKIVALISIRAERARIPFQIGFRVPRFNTVILFLGATMFFGGLLMPQVKNLMEIGLSSILLSVGVRLALREKA